MKGFLPSQWYVPVSTLLPVSKVLSFSPPQRSWFPSRIPGKLFPYSKDFSGPSVFPQWRLALKAAKKKRRQTHTLGKNTCDRTLQICIKHAMCFSQWYVPVLFFILLYFFFSPRRSRRGTLGISSPGGPVEEPLKPFCSFLFSSSSFVVRRVSMGILETDTWPEQDYKRESTVAQTFD